MMPSSLPSGPTSVSGSEEYQWQDKFEATQYLTKVFARLNNLIGSDVVLAVLEPKEREFLIESTKQAFILERQIPDPAIAQQVFTTMLVEGLMICFTGRNKSGNEIFNVIKSVIGGREDDPKEVVPPTPESAQTVGGKLKENISGLFRTGP